MQSRTIAVELIDARPLSQSFKLCTFWSIDVSFILGARNNAIVSIHTIACSSKSARNANKLPFFPSRIDSLSFVSVAHSIYRCSSQHFIRPNEVIAASMTPLFRSTPQICILYTLLYSLLYACMYVVYVYFAAYRLSTVRYEATSITLSEATTMHLHAPGLETRPSPRYCFCIPTDV